MESQSGTESINVISFRHLLGSHRDVAPTEPSLGTKADIYWYHVSGTVQRTLCQFSQLILIETP